MTTRDRGQRASAPRRIRRDDLKASGAHYTPPELAAFLARLTLRAASPRDLSVFDPACGSGILLEALVRAARACGRGVSRLAGVDEDAEAVRAARSRLSPLMDTVVSVDQGDFLRVVSGPAQDPQRSLFSATLPAPAVPQYDVVIANPPYVRTQVLGARLAQQLATTLGLSGRVDLYHAFIRAMTFVLREGGTLGLLCSNRFLSTKSGAAVRQTLLTHFELVHVLDLGDTKLFDAAVLPAIVIARKRSTHGDSRCQFTRIYEYRGEDEAHVEACPSLLAAVETGVEGLFRAEASGLTYRVERGYLGSTGGHAEPWSLTSGVREAWFGAVRSRTARVFGDVGKIRVGIKTTADSVFIREDWHTLPHELRPEAALLFPLLTHHVAECWRAREPTRMVLYTHAMRDGRRVPIDLGQYPRARHYLESHRDRLSGRRYVIDANREWYEIWVPQQPDEWLLPKVVFPDISEFPRFFHDASGSIVNGDCYWIAQAHGDDPRWMLLLLAVANSSFALRFYDFLCANQLYSGRRRFMTQYVERFPLPDVETPTAQKIVTLVQGVVNGALPSDSTRALLDRLVWESFGVEQTAG